MDLQLAGTKALVMGSRKGIGRAISETFLAERAFVAVRAPGTAALVPDTSTG